MGCQNYKIKDPEGISGARIMVDQSKSSAREIMDSGNDRTPVMRYYGPKKGKPDPPRKQKSFQYACSEFQQYETGFRCTYLAPHELDPAWAKLIETSYVTGIHEKLGGRLNLLLNETAFIQRRVRDDPHFLEQPLEGTDRETIDSLRDLTRDWRDNYDRILDQIEAGALEALEERARQGGPLRAQKIHPILDAMGIYISVDGFAWVVKPDHFFKVDLVDTQVYFFSRAVPSRFCRVCLVLASEAGWGNGLNLLELLFLAKIFALVYEELPTHMSRQMRQFRFDGSFGPNLFPIPLDHPVIPADALDAYLDRYSAPRDPEQPQRERNDRLLRPSDLFN